MTYAGDVTCKDTWNNLKENTKTCLVDVRTTREWETIGTPDLSSLGKKPIFEEWQMFPDMRLNPDFASNVDENLVANGVSKDDAIYFLCRSGARSQGAASALTLLGYTKCHNIIAGFEGNPDATGQRGTVSGWQFDKLPFQKE